MGCVLSSDSLKAPTLQERQEASLKQRIKSRLAQNLTHDEFERPISEVYTIDRESELGEGAYAHVRLATHK